MDLNNKVLLESGKKYNFLFDTSAILRFQALYEVCGVSIFKAINECKDINFFILNEVIMELMQGTKSISPTQIGGLLNHILNSESSMDRSHKENRFIINEKGQIKYIVLNKVSATDYAQILMCQNHPELTLVSNDKKMLKSAAQVIKGRRVIGIPALLDRLLILYPENERVKTLKKTGDKIFKKKHAFGSISKDQFNKLKRK